MPIHNLAIMILYFNVSMILLTVRQLQSREAFFSNVTLINTYTCTIFFYNFTINSIKLYYS